MDDVMNYDHNLTYCGRMASQRVRLTFGMWQYRCQMEVTVGGNCTGLTVIRSAVGIAFDRLCEEADERPDSILRLVLTDPNKDGTLICEDDEDRGEDWLGDMLISAEILSIEPEAQQEGSRDG